MAEAQVLTPDARAIHRRHAEGALDLAGRLVEAVDAVEIGLGRGKEFIVGGRKRCGRADAKRERGDKPEKRTIHDAAFERSSPDRSSTNMVNYGLTQLRRGEIPPNSAT